MSGKQHHYHLSLSWIGDQGEGTASYKGYARDHVLSAAGKPDIPGSSDPNFRGDPARWNPEELLVASVSACHQLWYLHLCATNGVVVRSYTDEPEGWMEEAADGGGAFTRVLLRPAVAISAGSAQTALALHHQAHDLCFIARSVNFPVDCEPRITQL